MTDTDTDNAQAPGKDQGRGLTLIEGGLSAAGQPTRHKGKGVTNEHGLTIRQEAFAQHASNGESLSNSYRLAGYDVSGMRPETIHREAYALSKNPKVAARIESLTREKASKDSHDASQARAWLMEQLKALASDTAQRTTDRLKAMELFGKLGNVSAFASQESDGKPESVSTIEARIRALLAAKH